MNAQSTTSVMPGAQILSAKTAATQWLQKAVRALGLGHKPRKPAIRHPVGFLTVHEDAICEIAPGNTGRVYMSPQPVEVVHKLAMRELDDGLCQYRFQLSAPADRVWRHFVKMLLPNLRMKFEGAFMTLVCAPADLESSYRQIKDAMAWANFWHDAEHQVLLAKIIALDQERQAALEMEENRKQGLQRQFDYLPI